MTDKVYDQREDLYAVERERLRSGALLQSVEEQRKNPRVVRGVTVKPLTDEQAEAAASLIRPMVERLKAMTPRELGLALEGFQRASESNCGYLTFALRHSMFPVIAMEANERQLKPNEWILREDD